MDRIVKITRVECSIPYAPAVVIDWILQKELVGKVPTPRQRIANIRGHEIHLYKTLI